MTAIPTDGDGDGDLGPDLDDANLDTLRNAFVEAYNARDLDAALELVSDDVTTPDLGTDGGEALAEELQARWERSPGVVLTNATVDDTVAAVAWLPDEGGRWTRAGLITFDGDHGRLTAIEMPDDADALQRALAESPVGDALDEEQDWSVWDRGEDSEGAGWGWDESQIRE
jgi:hypothetical protein